MLRLTSPHKYGNMGHVKTTLELPEQSFRKAKAIAASRGITLKAFFSEALEEKLQRTTSDLSDGKPWMQGFGELAHLREETKNILSNIEDEFGQIEPEEI